MPRSDVQRSNKGQKNNTPIVPTWMNYCMDCFFWKKSYRLPNPSTSRLCGNEKSEKRFKFTSQTDNCDHFVEE